MDARRTSRHRLNTAVNAAIYALRVQYVRKVAVAIQTQIISMSLVRNSNAVLGIIFMNISLTLLFRSAGEALGMLAQQRKWTTTRVGVLWNKCRRERQAVDVGDYIARM